MLDNEVLKELKLKKHSIIVGGFDKKLAVFERFWASGRFEI